MKPLNAGWFSSVHFFCFLIGAVAAAAPDVQNVSSINDYFGAKPPGDAAEIFAPGVVSLPERFEARIAFSPDLRECYLTETDATFSHPKLLVAYRKAEGWMAFQAPDFAAKFKVCHEPFLTADNKKLYFTADGVPNVAGNIRDFWVVSRVAGGWSEPARLPAPINSESAEFFLGESRDGLMVFASDRPGGAGNFDLYYITTSPDGVIRAVNFGAPVNTPGPEYDPCLSPDGRYIIFASARHGGPHLDLYVTYREANKGDGPATWSTPVPLTGGVNTPANEYGASLSPDGKYLFFVRHDGKQSDIYWMSTSQFAAASSGVASQ